MTKEILRSIDKKNKIYRKFIRIKSATKKRNCMRFSKSIEIP